MGLESATYISQLDTLWPLGGDPVNKGDDHVRLLKAVLKAQFPNFTAAAANITITELNLLVGLTANFSELNQLDGATVNSTKINRLNSISGNGALDAFPAGTKMLFQQTSAPTGWTKEVTYNDRALRIVSGAAGSGGSSPFSTVFGKTATDGHSLSIAEMPVHSHTVTDPGHGHDLAMGSGEGSSPTERCDQASSNTGLNFTNVQNNTTGISLGNAGSGNSHTHNMDIQVHYVDTIIASKN